MGPDMDNLRGINGDTSPLEGLDDDYWIDDSDIDDGDSDDAVMERPPAIGTDERRMQVRAYNYWTRLLGEHEYPLIEDLDPADALDFADHGVLLHFTDGLDNPAIAYLGSEIERESGLEETFERLDDVPPRSLLSRITDHYMQIHANKAPIGFEAEFVNQRGVTILYRGILLPFSSTGDDIDYIYGVINWKEAVGGPEADELLLEVSQALDSLQPEAPSMPSWQDGPIGDREPEEAFAADEAINADDDVAVPGEDSALRDWLQSARVAAEIADLADRRSRKALYRAVGLSYDFTCMAERDPETLAELLGEAGITTQPRAPYTPIVKLIFGVNYDKTRIAEIAALIGHAKASGLMVGECMQWIEQYPGGMKAIIAEARQKRGKSPTRPRRNEKLHRQLRAMPAHPISDFANGEGEFVLLVARRNGSGDVELIGAIEDEPQLTDKALKKLAR